MVIRAGVIGHPVGHSLSPALHARWLRAFGVDGAYEAVDPGPDGFADTVTRLREAGWAGLNVTLPFKAEALALADEADEAARRVGAANTLVFGAGGVAARNSDVTGFAGALTATGARPRSALVLGAGGPAPAVLAALSDLGVRELRLSNRTRASAEVLADRFGAAVVAWEDRNRAAETDLLVNATALGLPGKTVLDVDLSALPAHAVVADCVYVRGGVTPLVRDARVRDLVAFDGLPMLVRQAVPGFAAWYGFEPTDLAAAEADLRGLA